MCGLIGMAGPGIQWADIDILEDLSYVIALRGRDGAGIVQGRAPYYGNGVDNLLLEKSQYDINYFKSFHRYGKDGNDKLFRGLDNNFFAIHVRAATIGSISKENSHPFDVGDYIGMHNGTLEDKKYFSQDNTDSEMMFRDINDRGIKTVLNELDKKSAYAIVVLDKKTGEISFARNEKRTLAFCFHAHRNVMYWASESWMLRELIKRKGEKILGDDIWWFSPGYIYTIDPARPPRKVDDIEREILREEPEKKVKPKYKETSNETKKEGRKDDDKKSDKSVANVINILQNRPENRNVRVKAQTRVVKEESKNEKKYIPSMYCCGCQKPLSLVDQYFGKKFGTAAILCTDCEQQTQNLMVN